MFTIAGESNYSEAVKRFIEEMEAAILTGCTTAITTSVIITPNN